MHHRHQHKVELHASAGSRKTAYQETGQLEDIYVNDLKSRILSM